MPRCQLSTKPLERVQQVLYNSQEESACYRAFYENAEMAAIRIGVPDYRQEPKTQN